MALDHCQRVNEIALKIIHAERRLDQLKAAMEEWHAMPPYQLDKDTDAEGVGRYLWTYRLERLEPVPLEWSLLIGEFLYTVHSSLDHLAWLLAAQHSYPSQPERVTFPIYTSQSRFWQKGRDGEYRPGRGGWALERMPEPARQLVDELQPYKLKGRALEHPLWRLHELSNADKHKALHVVSSAVVDQQLETRRIEHAEIVSFDVAPGPVEGHNEVAWVRARRTTEPGVGPNPEIDFDVRVQVDEVFGDATPVPNVPVYDVLTDIYTYVRNEVWFDRFADYFEV